MECMTEEEQAEQIVLGSTKRETESMLQRDTKMTYIKRENFENKGNIFT